MAYLGYLLAFLYIFWLLYVAVMAIYRAHLMNKLHGLIKYMSIPVVALGALVDAFANIFIATVIFWERPYEWLVTTRLTRYQTYKEDHWRKKLAQYVCDKMLDPFDPYDNHC